MRAAELITHTLADATYMGCLVQISRTKKGRIHHILVQFMVMNAHVLTSNPLNLNTLNNEIMVTTTWMRSVFPFGSLSLLFQALFISQSFPIEDIRRGDGDLLLVCFTCTFFCCNAYSSSRRCFKIESLKYLIVASV